MQTRGLIESLRHVVDCNFPLTSIAISEWQTDHNNSNHIIPLIHEFPLSIIFTLFFFVHVYITNLTT